MDLLWNRLAAKAGLQMDDRQSQRLERFLDLLLQANTTMNLTRLADRPAARRGHVADALTLLPFLPRTAHSLADVGSGGGVPGMVLAILRPDAQVALIESVGKKARYLQETAAALALDNVQVLCQRAEQVQAQFDVVTARALAAMDPLVRWCLPLVRPGGVLLAMKGPKVQEELPAALAQIRRLGGSPPCIHPASSEELAGHVVVEIRKPGA